MQSREISLDRARRIAEIAKRVRAELDEETPTTRVRRRALPPSQAMAVRSSRGERFPSMHAAARAVGVRQTNIRRAVHFGWIVAGRYWISEDADAQTEIVAMARGVIHACGTGERLAIADAIGLARRAFGMWEVELREHREKGTGAA